MIEKIVTGGQTGVDQAALDTAMTLGIHCGGWCPKGRLAEDGAIHKKYPLKETKSDVYAERTKLNIRDSDGTLTLVAKLPIDVNDGTNLTLQESRAKNKPHQLIDLSKKDAIYQAINWINEENIGALNIAGPRESQSPGIYKKSIVFLTALMRLALE